MADISKINIAGENLNVKDTTARSEIDNIINGTTSLDSIQTVSDVSVGGDLTVSGNIYQQGQTIETHTQELYTSNDMIITRDGAETGLSSGEYTGLKAHNYKGDNVDGLLVYGNDGLARVGDAGDLQVIATREQTPTTNGMAVWSSSRQFITTTPTFSCICSNSAGATACTASVGLTDSYINGMTIKVLFVNGHYGSSFTLNVDSMGAKPIWVNKNGTASVMTSNSVAVGSETTARNWYVMPYVCLELMYVAGLNGGNGAWLIIGNPIVLSKTGASGYTIYADGSKMPNYYILSTIGQVTTISGFKLENKFENISNDATAIFCRLSLIGVGILILNGTVPNNITGTVALGFSMLPSNINYIETISIQIYQTAHVEPYVGYNAHYFDFYAIDCFSGANLNARATLLVRKSD